MNKNLLDGAVFLLVHFKKKRLRFDRFRSANTPGTWSIRYFASESVGMSKIYALVAKHDFVVRTKGFAKKKSLSATVDTHSTGVEDSSSKRVEPVSGTEGFICPECWCSFGTAEMLADHFSKCCS